MSSIIENLEKKIRESRPKTTDGHPRDPYLDDRYDRACFEVLNSEPGKLMFDWLKSITTHRVLGATTQANELFYQEGMRMLTALIEARSNAYRARQNKASKEVNNAD